MLTSVSSFNLSWLQTVHPQSLVMLHLRSAFTLSKTAPAARAGFAQVRVASDQLHGAAKYIACR